MRQTTATSLKSRDEKPLATASEGKNDMEKELADIKKEVVEARNLVIKTDNLLKGLHAELKTVAKQGEEFARKQWVSSAVAYVLFAVLCVAGAVLVSSASTQSARSERERLEKQVGELTSQLDAKKQELSAQQQARQAAADVYRMMTTLPGDERLKGIDALVKLDTSLLSPLERSALSDRASLLRKEVGDVAFERGKAAFRRNDMAATATELSRFLAMNPAPQDAVEASFFLGVAYNQLKEYEKSIPLFTRFIDEEKRSKNRDYAMLLLSHSLEQTGQFEKSAEVAREGLADFPNSQFAPQMRARLAIAKRQLAGGTAEAPAAGAPAAAQPRQATPGQP